MYPNPLPLHDGAAVVNYDYRGSETDSSKYQVANLPLSEPQTFIVSHKVTNVGKVNQTRRSLYRLDRVVVNDASGEIGTLSAYIVLVVPEQIAVSGELSEEVSKLKDLLVDQSAKIIAGDI